MEHEASMLADPHFWVNIGGLIFLAFAGPKRVQAPGVAFDVLPRIDVVLLSHDHYDHLDLPTIRALA